MARNDLTSGSSVLDASQLTTTDFQPGANRLVLAFVANYSISAKITATTPEVTGNGLTWQRVQTVLGGTNASRRLTCFRALGPAPTRGPLTISFGDQIQDLCAWSVFEYDGVDTSGTAGAGAVAQSQTTTTDGSSVAATLTPSADPTHNVTVGGVLVELINDVVRSVTPGAGYTEIHEQIPHQAAGQGATLQTQDSPSTQQTSTWTWDGVEKAAAIVLEVKSVSVGGTTPPGTEPATPEEALVRRFEPVLFFDPQESYFPVDPKRYLENAALWDAKAAFDDKNSWGTVSGTSFPRSPLVAAGQLRGLPSEGGTYLGKPGLLASGPTDERFLELGGWKDANQAHEPDVTSTSTNAYADRADIVQKYAGALEPSRFWYYAELYDTTRLGLLASAVTEINFTKIFTRLNHPALLCYYLFFPAHEESVGDGACPNIEAKEIGCHAGDWQCIALLLEGDGSGEPASFTPRFFGRTGVLPTPIFGDVHAFAFDDERRTAMTVAPWRAGTSSASIQPEVVGDHPRFYVAPGTHSLYTASGSHDVSTYPEGIAPRQCGRFDWPAPFELSHAGIDALEDTAKLFLAKMVGGGLAFPPSGLLIGYVAAIVESIIETSDDPEAPEDPSDVSNPDQAPTAGTGLTLRPAGLELPDAGDSPTDWRSREGLDADGRTYGFLVDRTTQVWWPSDDRQSGFLGRWGQRVAPDPAPRRCGPVFPDYWKMFLSALADGDARGLLTI